MKAAEIRRRFLEYFERNGHSIQPSSSLVPANDPTLLFTNAGMVQFKDVFLGEETRPYRRAVTSQKCVRAGGKHNDLEEVGKTARHHTFFEMLGNFSFGDYFKADAVRFAWEFLTGELGLDPERLYATVHHTDDEAAELWTEFLPPERIFRLGDKDNFWQMADTGPCGPCSELHFDMRPDSERSGALDVETFEALGDQDRMMELWNLVFMQFDRDHAGTLTPLPAPSIDTGAGLERLAVVLQGVDSNYHTDLFIPLLERVAAVVHRPYQAESEEGVAYRVISDHARAVAFLLADGVFPSNEGRGYVLRRILRRAVRFAWLLGLRVPTVVHVVEEVIDRMKDVYPQLQERREHLLATTRAEEERFLTTIEGGLERFDELAPVRASAHGDATPVIAGDDVFRLYDTFGFPADLTAMMAAERGYAIDGAGFEAALERQRERSRADRAQSRGDDVDGAVWEWTTRLDGEQTFAGYAPTPALRTRALASAETADGERAALVLEENPFYAEGGGQVSDHGTVEGDGFVLDVDLVFRVDGRTAVAGDLTGRFPSGSELHVDARVAPRLRHDTERNHTATHLLHAALRRVLGAHVVQKGSLVAPDRLRFDFAHPSPVTSEEVEQIEGEVNRHVWDNLPVRWQVLPIAEARERGAMALFGEKYGDLVRMVEVPDVSVELCGGTHVRSTGEIGLFRIVRESGVAAGVRRVEAVTGPMAYRELREAEARLGAVSARLKSTPDHVESRVDALLEERDQLEQLLKEMREGGGGAEDIVAERPLAVGSNGGAVVRVVRIRAQDADDVRTFGDAFRSSASGVAVVGADYSDGKRGLFTFVSDDLIGAGVRADQLIREIARRAGGSGGGRPHMAQGGVPDAEALTTALDAAADVVAALVAKGQ